MTPAANGTARVEFQVRFSRGPKGQRRVREAKQTPTVGEVRPKPVPADVPKMTRMLILGYHFERLVRDGKVKNYAEIARLTGLSRARVTQIVNLTLLTPRVQDEILSAGDRNGDPHPLERRLRRLPDKPSWPDEE